MDEHEKDLEELEARLTTPKPSRRSVLKGAGVAAGGLAAIGALGAAAVQSAQPAGATSGPDVPYPGAPSLALYLTLNGQQIQGDNTQSGQEGSIECVYFEQKGTQTVSGSTASGAGAGKAKRTYTPIVIRKFIDRSTPALHRGLAQGQLAEGSIKFFRSNADGFPDNFYSVSWKQGRILSVDDWSADNQAVAAQQEANSVPMQEISISFGAITWTYGETSFSDSISQKF